MIAFNHNMTNGSNNIPMFGMIPTHTKQEPIHLPPICSLLDYIEETTQ